MDHQTNIDHAHTNKLLLLEDDRSLVDGLSYSLKKNGFDVDIARTLEEAKKFLLHGEYDLLLLDITLPDGSGFEICEYVRGRGNQVPIIFLTALDEEVNVIRGLDCGGDDYITKPFKLGGAVLPNPRTAEKSRNVQKIRIFKALPWGYYN